MNALLAPLASGTRRRGSLAGGLVVALVATLAALGMAQAEEPSTARNLARNATPSASFTAGHNNLFAVNDGTHSNSGAPETSYWGTWTAVDRPSSHVLSYDWARPVTVDRSVISFWTDAAPGTGNNVTVPQSWVVQWWDDAAATWKPVANASGFGTSRTGTNVTTFDAVTTTRVRAVFQTYPNAGATSYSAIGVSEWELWGTIAEADPDAVIDVPAVDARTTPGVQPALPETLDVVRLGGRVTPTAVTWSAIPTGDLVAGAEVEVSGDLAGLEESATATVWVREALSTTIDEVEDASVITTVGVRPTLPGTVTATYDDGARDSGADVTWSAISRADYEAEGLFAVTGDVAGTDLPATAWVFVEAADGSAPTPRFELSTTPASPSGANGWFTGPVSVRVEPVDTDPASYESKTGGGEWTAVADQDVPVVGDGVHEVSVREVGTTDSQVVTVRLDATAPTSTATLANGVVTLDGADATSGVDVLEHRLGDSGAWTAYASPLTVAPGTTVQHRARDAAGNVGGVGSLVVPSVPSTPVPTPAPTAQPTPTTQPTPVTRATTRTTITAPRRIVEAGRVRVKIRVRADGLVPSGVVKVYDGTRRVARVRLSDGRASVRVRLEPGKHRLVARYVGSAAALPSAGSVRLRAT